MIGNRVEQLIEFLEHNKNSFAEEIGVAPTIIYNITGKRKSSPSFEVLEKVKRKFPNVNMNWIFNGEGSPLIEVETTPEIQTQVQTLTHRMKQYEELATVRDQYISVLREKMETLKSQVESTKQVSNEEHSS